MEWISIRDRLPEKGFCGLVYPNSVGVVGTGCFLGYERAPDYWAWSDNEDQGEPIAPWFWMPFPDAPESATNPYLLKK
jgi:hypothetical protein